MQPKHRFGWRPDTPDKRDKYKSINYFRRFSMMLPSAIDLAIAMTPTYDQGDLGSCTANAIGGAIEYGHIKQKLPPFIPSRLFIYYGEREIEGTIPVDAGAEIRNGIKLVASKGVCEEKVWPYDVEKFTIRPRMAAFNMAKHDVIRKYSRVYQTVDYMKATLALAVPIVFGFTCYESLDGKQVEKTGVVPMPGTRERSVGGHAVLMCGYSNDKQQFKFRNSWGQWGDKGYGYLPFDYAVNSDLAADFWAIEMVQ